MSAQRRFRTACAFAQSDQNLHWTKFGYPRMWSCFTRKMKTLISLCGFAGWFGSTSCAHVWSYVVSIKLVWKRNKLGIKSCQRHCSHVKQLCQINQPVDTGITVKGLGRNKIRFNKMNYGNLFIRNLLQLTLASLIKFIVRRNEKQTKKNKHLTNNISLLLALDLVWFQSLVTIFS